MRVTVDLEACASTGACAQTCPEVFELRNDGALQVRLASPPPELHDEVIEASELCPTGAITIHE